MATNGSGTDAEGRIATPLPDDDGKGGGPPTAKGSTPEETAAQIAQQGTSIDELKDLVKTLEASNRTLQGQVRSYEARLAQPPRTVEPEPDLLEGVDTSDPDQAKMVAAIKTLQAENIRLRNAANAAAVGNEARTVREAWIAHYQTKFATPLGLDPDVVEQAARKIPPNVTVDVFADTLADELALLLKGQGSPADAIAKAKEDGKKEALAQLEEQFPGLYSGAEARVRGGTAMTKGNMTAADLKAMSPQQVAAMKFTKEELVAIQKRK